MPVNRERNALREGACGAQTLYMTGRMQTDRKHPRDTDSPGSD
jgi:hypothetical protein